MASQLPPVKNAALTFYVSLVSQANTKVLQTNPTLAAGDVQVSTDGGAFGNLATLPAVTPAAGKAVKVDLSAAEMNGDNVVVMFSDAAGSEWCDLEVSIQTAAQTFDAMHSRVGAPAGASIAADIAVIESQTDDIGVAGAGLTAIDLPDQTMNITGNITGNLSGSVGSVTADVGITQAGADKVWGTAARTLTAFAFAVDISAAGVQAVWDALTAALTTVGSIGKWIVDKLDVAVSTRGTGTALTSQEVRDAMKLAPTAGAPAAGSVDEHLDDILADTNDIQTRLPAALVGGRMDADVGALQAGVITAAAIANGAIDAATFAAGAIDAAAIADGAIDAATFAAGAITAAALAADAGAEIADAILDRDMSTGVDNGSTTVRTPRQALRFLRNKWDVTAGTLTVKKEDDATTSWTATVTADAAANPIVATDPAGP